MSYMGAHDRTRRIRGKASLQTCPCGAPACEWSLNHDAAITETDAYGRYSRNPADYTARCKPCHQHYDKSLITHCPRGHEYAGENLIRDAGKRKCRTCVYARNRQWRKSNPLTPERHARRMELQRERRRKARGAQEQAA